MGRRKRGVVTRSGLFISTGLFVGEEKGGGKPGKVEEKARTRRPVVMSHKWGACGLLVHLDCRQAGGVVLKSTVRST